MEPAYPPSMGQAASVRQLGETMLYSIVARVNKKISTCGLLGDILSVIHFLTQRWQRVRKTRESADTRSAGCGFGFGFVPAGAGMIVNPTGIL